MSTISLLLPIYYKESVETINKCLDSMAQQTVLPDEIVCALDEPSSPEVEGALDEFAKQHGDIAIVKCYCPRGSGLGAVLNAGVLHCSCEYIARMDADDIAQLDRLEKERDFLDQNPEVDVVGSNIAEFETSKDEVIAYRVVPADDKACKAMLKRRDPINHMTAMYRKKSILKAGNYSCEMKACEDTDLWARFYEHGLCFANIQENLVYVHAGRDMYERRGRGQEYQYVKKVINYKKKIGLINAADCLFQKMANYCVLVVMSTKMRAFVYEHFLRKKN